MSEVSAYRVLIDTNSADENGVLLFIRDHLVACVMRLDDPSHGRDRDRWCVETAYGFDSRKLPETFLSIEAAISAISEEICGSPLAVVGELPALP
ncbi:hypothetical protein GCM10011494_01250 [Novosphingobium endophyticum]|uniref:Uncharacterized protein n=1 Tax=Novosphingobium endophyticum TaxID=1955250 RepID=A0A916TNZ7_9SPHN|nr:hypothetical protein [Novosphingobium endophyticum]GGB86698.1 hypothetical protein GCM10011494_01250 [Novosphingobium endophyticum]